MPVLTPGPVPELPALVPSIGTLAPPLGRAVLTVLAGSPLPLREAAALLQPGAYIILLRRPNELPAAYVGMSGAIAERLLGHERLRPNSCSAQIIAITSDANDLDRSDARVLERLSYAVLGTCADLELLNDEPPFHAHRPGVRYAQLRVFLGDAFCRLAESGLIPFNRPMIDLLAGPKLAFDELLEPVDPTALVGAQRRRYIKRCQVAEALFLTNGSAILKAGSQIRATEVNSLHGGISALRHEAVFSGVVAPNDHGTLTVAHDLVFGSWNSLAQFVSASSSGQVSAWRPVEPNIAADTQILNPDGDLLALWRSMAVPVGDTGTANSLRAVLNKVVPIGFAAARSGAGCENLAASVRTAVKITNMAQAGPATLVIDIAMSAVFLCAILGQHGAADVLDTLMFRLASKGVPIEAPISLGARL